MKPHRTKYENYRIEKKWNWNNDKNRQSSSTELKEVMKVNKKLLKLINKKDICRWDRNANILVRHQARIVPSCLLMHTLTSQASDKNCTFVSLTAHLNPQPFKNIGECCVSFVWSSGICALPPQTCRGKCVPYKACVQCQIFQTGEFTPEECEANCTLFNATAVDIAGEYHIRGGGLLKWWWLGVFASTAAAAATGGGDG